MKRWCHGCVSWALRCVAFCCFTLVSFASTNARAEDSAVLIYTVPAGVSVRIQGTNELYKSMQAQALASAFWGGGNADMGGVLVNASFAGPTHISPVRLMLQPGTYSVAIEFTDKPQDVQEAFGETFRKEVGARKDTLCKQELNQNTGVRSVKWRATVDVPTNKNVAVGFHLLPTKLSLQEAIKQYPKTESFNLEEPAVAKALEEHGLPPIEVKECISALRRGGIVYVPEEETHKAFLVEVDGDKTVTFTEKK